MAKRPLIDKSIGAPTKPQPLMLEDGKLTQESAEYLYGLTLSLQRAINNLRFGDGSPGSKAGNLHGQWVSVTTPSVADTEFRVDHGLERLPVAVLIGLADKAASIYISNYGSWSNRVLYLKCSAASATLNLLIL
jgi:hypothetical protein